MAKKGIGNVAGMRGRRKGGKAAPDAGERPAEGTIAAFAEEWVGRMEERAYSPRSVSMHRAALKPFVAWCRERDIVDPKAITKPILESFQGWLFRYKKKDGKPLGVSTQRNRLGALQRLFKWLCKENHIPANPAADLDLPRKPQKLLPKALSHEDLAKLFAMPDTGDPLGLRDRSILETLYSCGLRRGEVTNLDIDDLDAGRGVITVRQGKGGKSRTVPVGERALKWLGKYLDLSRPRLAIEPGEKALFISGYGTRLSSTYVGNWVSRTIKAAGIDRRGSCHLLRHSCATHMLEGGADIRFIGQLLGHARLETTQIYTEVTINQLREVHARTHPHGTDGNTRQGTGERLD